MQYEVLYKSVEELAEMLEHHRLGWVLDLTQELATDILKDHVGRISEYDLQCCEFIKNGKMQTKLHKLPAETDIALRRFLIARRLYDIFKVCRKLKDCDKEIVVANFLDTAIGDNNF